jgi:uncharacterized protein YdcH (DUF465 family)
MNKKKDDLDKVIKGMEGESKAQQAALLQVKNQKSPQAVSLQQQSQTTKKEIDQLKKQREELMAITTEMNGLTV